MVIFGHKPLIPPRNGQSYPFVGLRGFHSKISHFISSAYF